MTSASETPPASERSKPPCWTTSSCPRPTMATIAAKGRLPDKAPQVTLDGANNRHATMSAAVEMTTVMKLLARAKGKAFRRLGKTAAVLTVWFIHASCAQRACLRENLGRAEHVEGVRERPHGVLISGEAHVPALGHVVEVLDDPPQVRIAVPPRC